MLNRRRFMGAAAMGGLALAVPEFALATARPRYSRRVVKLVENAVAADMLGVVTIGDQEWARWANSADGMTGEELRHFRDCGIRVFHHAIGISGANAYTEALTYMARLNGFIARYADRFARVTSLQEFDALKASGKTGVILGVQNSDHFRTVDDIGLFYSLGQRVSQLTYNSQNLIGCGSTERADCGITDFGVKVIEAMNAIGMLVDVSHCGERTTLESFEVSSKPVAITHSNCRALVDHPRLKSDEIIRKLAASGGVMGITGVRMFVRDQEPTTIEHIVDHIEHVARLVGAEFVGIGSDSDLSGYDALPAEQNQKVRAAYKASYGFREKIDIEEFSHPMKIFDLTEALLRRGFGDADIVGILGGNFRRLLGQVWK